MTALCSKCHGEFAVEDLHEGARCPDCGTVVSIPAEFPTAPENGRLERAEGRKLTAEIPGGAKAQRAQESTQRARAPVAPARNVAPPAPRSAVSAARLAAAPPANKSVVSAGRLAAAPAAPLPPPPRGVRAPAEDVPATIVEHGAPAPVPPAPPVPPARRPETQQELTPADPPASEVTAELPAQKRPAPKPAPVEAPPAAEVTAEVPAQKRPAPKPVEVPPPPVAARPAEATHELPLERLPARRGDAAPPVEPGPPELTQARTLGGYQIKRRLGHGGMGTVYLARQLSLDRDVAVKLLHPALSTDAEFLTRFTREAYAAAHLTHHNIVQIYDIGSEGQNKFYSMEFVDGPTLGAVVASKEKVDPDVAAGYILQAARGLGFAHAHGMIHRDIKPDNLMLNDQGLIKVADLGLVKVDGVADPERVKDSDGNALPRPVVGGTLNVEISLSHVTNIKSSMGTPAFMSPEQARDASNVDGRADIYSLGCTLYFLLTGRPPFKAPTELAVMYAHVSQEVVPPDALVKRVPKLLSDIVLRMLEKNPDLRYQTMAEVAQALEGFLGVDGSKLFSPREEHAEILEASINEYNRSTWSRRRFWGLLAFILLGPVASGLTAMFLPSESSTELAATLGGGYLLTLAFYFVLHGVASHSYLFQLTRQFVFGSRIWVLLAWLLVFAGGGLLLFEYDLQYWGLGALLGSLAAALGLYFGVDRRVQKERKGPVEKVEAMLKSLRLRGLEEGALRQFVCKYSGLRWEEFYEALFGYDAKIEARSRWGRAENGKPRKRFGTWRDPVIRFLETWQAKRSAAKEKRDIAALDPQAPARA